MIPTCYKLIGVNACLELSIVVTFVALLVVYRSGNKFLETHHLSASRGENRGGGVRHWTVVCVDYVCDEQYSGKFKFSLYTLRAVSMSHFVSSLQCCKHSVGWKAGP